MGKNNRRPPVKTNRRGGAKVKNLPPPPQELVKKIEERLEAIEDQLAPVPTVPKPKKKVKKESTSGSD